MSEEAKMSPYWDPDGLMSANEIIGLTNQILEITKSAFVLRSYNKYYGITSDDRTCESVSAHTNLFMAIVDRALSFIYGSGEDFVATRDGFFYREIMEAIRLHDLPENEIGDIPDNGDTDEDYKEKAEDLFFEAFMDSYAVRDIDFKGSVKDLLDSMRSLTLPTGRLLFLADKTAALLMTLAYDKFWESPMMHESNPNASARDLEAMALCDWNQRGFHLASEMWAIDFFKLRKIVDLDETGFFVSLIVMCTLVVKGQWYSWREKDYANNT